MLHKNHVLHSTSTYMSRHNSQLWEKMSDSSTEWLFTTSWMNPIHLWMVFWRVSMLVWQRSSVLLVMLTLIESMHTLSRRTKMTQNCSAWSGMVEKLHTELLPQVNLYNPFQCIQAIQRNENKKPLDVTWFDLPMLCASSKTTTDFFASSFETRSAIFGSRR